MNYVVFKNRNLWLRRRIIVLLRQIIKTTYGDTINRWVFSFLVCCSLHVKIAIITVELAGKASFVYSYMHTRPMGQYNWKWPISLAYVSKPLGTVITAIWKKWQSNHQSFPLFCFIFLELGLRNTNDHFTSPEAMLSSPFEHNRTSPSPTRFVLH